MKLSSSATGVQLWKLFELCVDRVLMREKIAKNYESKLTSSSKRHQSIAGSNACDAGTL